MSDPKPRLAIVEDHQDLREELVEFLHARGYPAWGAASAEALWRHLLAQPVDIVIVDLSLPGEDGFEVIRYLRELSNYGVVVITARGGQLDRLRALDLGADLYRVKPVNFARLATDVDALWARLDRAAPAQGKTAAAPQAQVWRLDVASASLDHISGARLKLSAQEFALVDILHRHLGEVQAKRDLHDAIFSFETEPDTHRVDVVLSRLRLKAARQRLRLPIRTVFGRGVVFNDE